MLWKPEKSSQSDGVNSNVGGEIFQNHRLGTAKSHHLTDEETKAQREAMSHLRSTSQSGQNLIQNPNLWISSSCLAPSLHPIPSGSLPRGLRENILSFVLIGGLLTCPLLGLGDAWTCPLVELAGACLAFVYTDQFSVTTG